MVVVGDIAGTFSGRRGGRLGGSLVPRAVRALGAQPVAGCSGVRARLLQNVGQHAVGHARDVGAGGLVVGGERVPHSGQRT